MDSGSNGEEPTSWEELYNINLMPSELFLKFRKEIQGMRLGVNLEVLFLFVESFYRLVFMSKSILYKVHFESFSHMVRRFFHSSFMLRSINQ